MSMSNRLSRVITQQLKHASRALWLSIKQHAATRFERLNTKIVRAVALCAINAIKECCDIKHFRAMLKKVTINNRAL
jgi:hypothetical protein